MEIYQRDDVVKSMWTNGGNLQSGINDLAKIYGLEDYVEVDGYACSPSYTTRDLEKNPCLGFRTLLAQELVKKGVLMPYISIASSHNKETLDLTLNAFDNAFKVYKKGLENGLKTVLESAIIKPVFRKYN